MFLVSTSRLVAGAGACSKHLGHYFRPVQQGRDYCLSSFSTVLTKRQRVNAGSKTAESNVTRKPEMTMTSTLKTNFAVRGSYMAEAALHHLELIHQLLVQRPHFGMHQLVVHSQAGSQDVNLEQRPSVN